MAVDSARDAVTALRRFGLGARPGELARIAGDPRGYVLGMLARRDRVALDDPDLDPSHIILANMQLIGQQARAQRERVQDAMREVSGVPFPGTQGAAPAEMQKGGAQKLAKAGPRIGAARREVYQDEAAVRFERMITTDDALLERLVMFWSNHFCVSVGKGQVRALAGAFEREAIRPHVLGRFADMLLAVESHPAMLIYLDNQLSFGPNSQAGKNRKKGLNENLAREILELHTLGVDGGYTQDDVTNLARIIAGWAIGGINQAKVEPGKFFYMPQRREPGTWSVVKRSYENTGHETGRQVLADLAKHPSTARHIARKLAVHFVAEAPPPALVASLERTFRDTDGDLAAVTRTLVTHADAWSTPASRVTPPNDFLIALARGLWSNPRPKSQEVVRLSNQLGQPLWGVPSPKGWPEAAETWANPSALRERLRVAEQVARQIDKTLDPRAAAEDLFGVALSNETRQAIARAETREQGVTLLVMSPENLKR
jgi:uncharacterized protein (DUF1800 family)